MKFLIITNSYKREQALVERSLAASVGQDLSPDYVYFIDQNTEPLKINSNISSFKNFKQFHVETKCVSTARNSVEVPSDVDWIFFCDDDGYPMEGYLTRLRETIKLNPEVDVIAGSIVRDDNFEFYSPRHAMGGDINKFQNTKLLMGSNFSCKAKVFKDLRGFDERFGAGSFWGSGEETDFAWKVFFSKYQMLYEKDLKVFHVRPYAQSFNDNVRKAYRYGIGKGALVAKWLFRKRKLYVLYEVFEMTAVPLFQSVKALVTLRLKDIPVYFSSLISRYIGMLLYLLREK